MFNHLQYYQVAYETIFLPQISKHYPNHLVYSQSNTKEELYFPSKRHTLSQSELKKIKEHFSVSHNVRGRKLSVIFNLF